MYCYYNPRPERTKTKSKRFVRDQRWKLYGDGRFFDVANDVLEKSPLDQDTVFGEAAAARKKLTAALKTMPAKGQSLLKYGK